MVSFAGPSQVYSSTLQTPVDIVILEAQWVFLCKQGPFECLHDAVQFSIAMPVSVACIQHAESSLAACFWVVSYTFDPGDDVFGFHAPAQCAQPACVPEVNLEPHNRFEVHLPHQLNPGRLSTALV